MSKKSSSAQATPSTPNQAPVYDIRAVMKTFTPDQVQKFAEKLEAEFDDRKRHEISSVENGTADLPVVQKLNRYQKPLMLPDVLRAMMALEVDPGFVNHSFSKGGTGARFNIYAIDKAGKILKFIAGSASLTNNAIIHDLKAMLKFDQITRHQARAALSKSIRPLNDNVIKDMDSRHHLSASTAPTQVSSNFRILQALKLAVNRGDQRNPIYAFADTDQGNAFKRLLIAA